jgi:hypothetical protein
MTNNDLLAVAVMSGVETKTFVIRIFVKTHIRNSRKYLWNKKAAIFRKVKILREI